MANRVESVRSRIRSSTMARLKLGSDKVSAMIATA